MKSVGVLLPLPVAVSPVVAAFAFPVVLVLFPLVLCFYLMRVYLLLYLRVPSFVSALSSPCRPAACIALSVGTTTTTSTVVAVVVLDVIHMPYQYTVLAFVLFSSAFSHILQTCASGRHFQHSSHVPRRLRTGRCTDVRPDTPAYSPGHYVAHARR